VALPPLSWLSTFARCAAITASLPELPTPLPTLKSTTGMTAQALRLHLSLAGWHQEYVWSRCADGSRSLTCWWCPPGTQAPRPPRGRPRIYATLDEVFAALARRREAPQ